MQLLYQRYAPEVRLTARVQCLLLLRGACHKLQDRTVDHMGRVATAGHQPSSRTMSDLSPPPSLSPNPRRSVRESQGRSWESRPHPAATTSKTVPDEPLGVFRLRTRTR